MLSRFFIDRPVFAWVIAIIMMLAGTLAMLSLPVMQYPGIAPPQVAISVTYPGASAQTVQDTVVQVIEQQLNGIDNLLFFDSQTTKDGAAVKTMEDRVTIRSGESRLVIERGRIARVISEPAVEPKPQA